jgi:hypothetical protein
MVRARFAAWSLLAPLLLGGAPCALAQQGHVHAEKGHAMPRGDLGASAAFDASGAMWAVAKEGGYVALHRSDDFGRTWRKLGPVNAVAEGIGADGDARPKIALGRGGEIYVTWTQPLSKPYTGNIRFARSLDGGCSFSAPVTVHTDRQEITHRFDAVTVNRDGQVFVAWVDKRDQEAVRAKKGAYRGAAIYYAVSDDRGASFRGDFKLADYSCECCRIALLPRDDGSVLAMWRHVFEPNIRDHALARMTPNGRAGELKRVTFDDWRIDACPHHGPSLAADAAGRLHAVWFDQGPQRRGVFYGRLGDGGVEGQQRIGGETAEHADIAIAGKRIAVAWKEFDGKQSRLKARLSEDGGKNWREQEIAVTAGASGQPFVLAHRDVFYVFWNTRNEPLSVRALP